MGNEVLRIKLSAMWFTQHNSISDVIFESKRLKNYYRVCYSMHSSCSEIVDCVEYLQPETIVPLVIPINSSPEQVCKFCVLFSFLLVMFLLECFVKP